MSDDLTLPAKPEGDETDGLTPPTKPEGEQDDMKQPPEAKTVELDVSDAAITEDGEDASLGDIEVRRYADGGAGRGWQRGLRDHR